MAGAWTGELTGIWTGKLTRILTRELTSIDELVLVPKPIYLSGCLNRGQ